MTGTRVTLNYASDRVPGRKAARHLNIVLSRDQLPASLKRIDAVIDIAGRRFTQSFPAQTDQVFSFDWDGLDAYGRSVVGNQAASVKVGYVYDAVYARPAQVAAAFGQFSGVPLQLNQTRSEFTLWKYHKTTLGNAIVGTQPIAGWSVSAHHRYDPVGRILNYGDGTRRSTTAVSSDVITTVAGGGTTAFVGDGGPAIAAGLSSPRGSVVGSDGSIFIADAGHNRVRRVSPDGIITTIAGNGSAVFSGDNGLATSAGMEPHDVALGPDGSLYIADSDNHRIRKVSPAGTITTIAGNGMAAFAGDNGPATSASLRFPESIAMGADGSLYIADRVNQRIRKISPDGFIATVAGSGLSGFAGDGGPAKSARLSNPNGVTVDRDGNIFIADQGNRRIRKVSPAGIITTVAGNGTLVFQSGVPATQAGFSPDDVVAATDGSVYIVENNGAATSSALNGIRKVSPDGIITTFSGGGPDDNLGEGGPATQADILPAGVSIGPDGSVYFGNGIRFSKVSSTLSGFTASEIAIPSEDGSLVYRFETAGRHLATLNALTDVTLLSFAYDSLGKLTSITDGDGLVTTIERNSVGTATAIVAPFGQRTTFTVDSNGYLATVTNPANEFHSMIYSADGLLASFKDPRDNASTFTYDTLGRLFTDQNAASGSIAIARTDLLDGHTVALTTGLGRVTTHSLQQLMTNERERMHIQPNGTTSSSLEKTDGTTTNVDADGTVATVVEGPDPRFAMLSPIAKNATLATGGLTAVLSSQRAANLADPLDPLSLTTLTDILTINGRASTSFYDAASKTVTFTSPANRQGSSQIDNLGRLLSRQVSGILPVSNTYDAQGRLATIKQGVDVDERLVTFTYDSQGYLETVTDPLLRQTSYEYDLAGRVTKQVLPDGREILFTYDANGNLNSLTPPGRPAHAFTYTPVNLMSSYTPPNVGAGTNSTGYTFNSDKQITQILRPDGFSLNYNYDAAGRLSELTIPGGTYTFAYDGTTDKLTSTSTPSGHGLSYSYNGALLTETQWSGSVSGMTRDAQNGLLTGTSLGNVNDAYTYDGFGEISVYEAKFGATSLLKIEYDRDKLGRITQKRETRSGILRTFDYAYDLAGRLNEVRQDGLLVASYAYDANGNRTHVNGSLVGQYDDQDRLLSYNGNTYTYSENGELKSKTNGASVTNYVYDVLGNLKQVTLPDGTTIDYIIDGQNRRIGKKVNGTLVQGFLWESQLRPAAELDGSGNVVSRFVYATGVNVPDYMIKGGVTYRFIKNHLGSPRLIMNGSTNAVAQELDYDEFGNVILDTNPGFQPFGFAGGINDRDTGLVRFGVRDYGPAIARWLAKDPISFDAKDSNIYSYAFGDPINHVDLDGQIVSFLISGVLNAVVNVGVTYLTNSCAQPRDYFAAAASGFVSGFVGGVGGSIAREIAPALVKYGYASTLRARVVANFSGLTAAAFVGVRAGELGDFVAALINPEGNNNSVAASGFSAAVSHALVPESRVAAVTGAILNAELSSAFASFGNRGGCQCGPR